MAQTHRTLSEPQDMSQAWLSFRDRKLIRIKRHINETRIESYYALTISIYASKEIQEQANMESVG